MTIYQITAKIPSENSPAVIYNSSLQNDRAYALADPSLDGECGKAGTLEFNIPYGHPYYSRLTKLTTEIVFTQDDEELFRGRVYEIRTDIETERTVTCEGNLSYLVDSLQPPDRIKGKNTHTVEYDSEDGKTSYSKEYSIDKEEGTKETLEAHFRRLINKHNEQVEAWKQFAVGEITIDEKTTEITFDDSSYRTTLDALESDLINLYGGWLRTRRVGNTTYLDWLKDYGTTSTQTFNYGQNIVEFDYTSNAEDMFTILVPVGDDGLTIESVNNGKIGLENAAGIATFGKIYKTESFSGVTDAAKLKSLGEKYMQRNYKDPKRSISVTAVDMHLIDPSVRAFHLGDKIRLIAPVQGIDETIECLSYTITPNEPENNTYELGDRDETMSQKWTKDVDKSAADAANAARSARTGGGGVGQLFKYMYEQGHDLIANYDNIKLTANRVDATIENMNIVSGRLTEVGTQVNLNKEGIQTLVTKTGIEGLDEDETIFSRIIQQADKIALVVEDVDGEGKVKAASIVAEINKQSGQSQVKLSADQIDIDGLVDHLRTKSLSVSNLSVTGAITSSNGSLTIPTIYLGTTESKKSLATALEDVQIIQESTNVYRLQKKTFGVPKWQNCDITFSRATTLSGAWSSGVYTINASPQGNIMSIGLFDVPAGDVTWDGNTASFPVKANLDGGETAYNTGKTLSIDATARYNAGKADGDTAGYNRGYIQGYNDNITAYIEEAENNEGAVRTLGYDESYVVHARYKNYEGVSARSNVTYSSYTIKAPSDRYTEGYSDGQSDGGLAIDYDNNNISATNSQTKVVYIQATASISYNSESHRYTATGKAQVAPSGSEYSDMDTARDVSGTEAYDAGVNAGYGSARLSLNTANHTINIGNTGNKVSATVRSTVQVDEWSAESRGYPITASAIVDGVTMYSTAALVKCEPSGSYSNGYTTGYNDNITAYIEEAENNEGAVRTLSYDESYVVHARYKNYEGVSARSNVTYSSYTIKAPSDRYDAGVAAGYGSARLSLNTANHTIDIGNTGNLVSAAVQVSGSVGEYDSTNESYPVVIKALVNGVEMNADTIQITCEPSGAYDNGYDAGDTAGYNRGYPIGYNANNTAYIEESGKTLGYGESFTVHARYKNYEGVSARSNAENSSITITAPADRYNDGYTQGYNTGNIAGYNANNTAYIEESSQTLAYGASLTVHARYKNYDGASARSNAENSSITITAPGDRYNDGYTQGYSDGYSAGYGIGYDAGDAYGREAVRSMYTPMYDCKANVRLAWANKVKMYYRSATGSYVAPVNGEYYWYYSSTKATPTTYYRYDND